MKISKMIVAILIFAIVFVMVTSFASQSDSKLYGEAGVLIQEGQATAKTTGSIETIIGEAKPVEVNNTVASNILGAMQWFGYAIAVGMLIYIGIKYTMSAADERANLKGSLVKYVIGALLIVTASSIIGWIISIGKDSIAV